MFVQIKQVIYSQDVGKPLPEELVEPPERGSLVYSTRRFCGTIREVGKEMLPLIPSLNYREEQLDSKSSGEHGSDKTQIDRECIATGAFDIEQESEKQVDVQQQGRTDRSKVLDEGEEA